MQNAIGNVFAPEPPAEGALGTSQDADFGPHVYIDIY